MPSAAAASLLLSASRNRDTASAPLGALVPEACGVCLGPSELCRELSTCI